jgi:PadR family transcriptional regulator PadR
MNDLADQSDWIAQTRRGVLELCLLMLLRSQPRYGYELLSALARWPALEVPEGTLYPLLRRLERGGLLQSSWKESFAGPPRKYYSLTKDGRRQMDRKSTQWDAIALSVADLKRSGGLSTVNRALKSAGGVAQ